MELELGDDHRKAGVGRYVLRVLETLLQGNHGHHLVVLHRPETVIPEEWLSLSNAEFHSTWNRTRTYEMIGRDLEPLRRNLDAWWSLGGRVPRTPLRGPRVSMIHDVFFRTFPETYTHEDRAIHEAKTEQIARYADLIVTNSEHTRTETMREYGRKPETVFAAPLGLGNLGTRIAPENVDRELLRGLGVPDGRYLFALSTLEPRKNFPRLLQAFASVQSDPRLAGVNLIVGGGKGWKEGEIFERLTGLGLNGRVHFAGYVPDQAVAHLFAGAEGFFLPSLIEGFGITILEAMHYGTPVACAGTGSLPEVAGGLAITFDPLDVGSMARAILELVSLSDRDTRIQTGIARAAGFTWEANVRTVLDRIESYRR